MCGLNRWPYTLPWSLCGAAAEGSSTRGFGCPVGDIGFVSSAAVSMHANKKARDWATGARRRIGIVFVFCYRGHGHVFLV